MVVRDLALVVWVLVCRPLEPPGSSAAMNLERVSNEEKLNLCRKYYLGKADPPRFRVIQGTGLERPEARGHSELDCGFLGVTQLGM